MKKYILIAVFSGCIGILAAQEVISSAGNHAEASGIQLSWTLGEPVVETIANGGNILTQGFHQTKLTVTPVLTFIRNNDVKVYPNPTKELVYIQFDDSPEVDAFVELFTLEGKLVKKVQVKENLNSFDVHSLPDGSYLLKIAKNKEWIQYFKIIKTL